MYGTTVSQWSLLGQESVFDPPEVGRLQAGCELTSVGFVDDCRWLITHGVGRLAVTRAPLLLSGHLGSSPWWAGWRYASG